MKPTEQQQLILDYQSNAVIIAAPGSGKTFVVAEKIKGILNSLNEHEGLIAISYTNKASNELRERSLKNGISPKSSFFGTMDKFFISEIIVPFGKHLFGLPANDIQVIKIDTLPEVEQNNFNWFNRDLTLGDLSDDNVDILKYYFSQGIILLDSVGVFSNYIFTKSVACKKYIKAKYRYIFIDEYQDSGSNQHEIFIKINQLGIIGFAVGDLNQSIYAFSGKNSKYLSDLTVHDDFKLFKLTKNHRCDPSIINYSNYLLNPKVELIPVEKSRVCFFRITGNEVNIAQWIDKVLESVKKEFSIVDSCQIAILTRGNRTANIINQNLSTPHKLSIATELDSSLNIWSAIFSNLLYFVYDKTYRFIEVVEEFTSYEKFTRAELKRIVQLKNEVLNLFEQEELNSSEIIKSFISIAEIIAPNSKNKDSIELLKTVLKSKEQLDSYKPSSNNEITIMTLHKSKGLEFDIVIHLDLYQWILPNKGPGPNNDWKNPVFSNWIQDINLHYVGITRAKKGCILISSTKRTNDSGQEKKGDDSEFIWHNNIKDLRLMSKEY